MDGQGERCGRFDAGLSSEIGAAPHLPAGILSPYSDGERGAVIAGFADRYRGSRKIASVADSSLLPVTIRGEVPGRAMRGSANLDNRSETIASSGMAARRTYRGWRRKK
ncbi:MULTISPECIES: hypothetical protein [unclassified Mesorhizobium]|uniref:hypothetical protein n=1 Tax=unclassified Mesorhizobium TaxID=325217 RepID=UPI000FCBED4E|nr:MULTISPECIES: hypothetical protein [unclassified Mesorhizobium]RUW34439.1 hypothetical protein EOA38_10585 [Mesorhizobium sp. M1E.F.Ca.ET.041.01.1.1]RWD79273.1 MAG: hypothetical protein EOS38_32040 [Mesorhizobium sp.]RWD82205.1 MAG: hypothetical protein EOS39_30530 [Mesorhizobium sp.]